APEVREPDPPMPETGLLQLDCTHAAQQLHWSATLTFEETARFTAEWYRLHRQAPASAADCTSRQIAEYTALARRRGKLWAGPAP
ncbi:MAG: CDP-glucose 4,6-dehydratase, partial [Opitutales bacterium]